MKNLFLLLSVATLFASCSPKIPFTQAIRNDYNLTESEIKQIQFYTSSDIILVRGTKENEKETDNHTLVVRSGKSVEEVVIPKGTPGMAEFADDHIIKVSFENGKNRSLAFGVTMGSDNTYKFIAQEWKDDKGKVLYDGRTFYALKGAESVELLFRLKNLDVYKTKRRVAGGKSFNVY